MFSPTLRIPQQEAISENYHGVKPDEVSVQNWLNTRDHLDLQVFLNTLVKLNRIQCSPADRMAIMLLLDIEIKQECDALIGKTNSVSFPINEEYQLHINHLQQLLLESSVAYQIIIHDIANNKKYVDQYIGSLVPEALFMALFYFSRLLVERFQFYLSEPVHIWQELNQLYLLAERIGAQDYLVGKKVSLKSCYLQIAILKILNPYRMMRLEARKIYDLLAGWVEHCEIIAYGKSVLEQKFVVDLLSDQSPHYFDKEKDAKKSNAEKFEGRIVTMDKLKVFLDAHLEQIMEQKHDRVLSYQSRIHNEMLQRIDNEINVHEERSEERQLIGNEIKLVSGFRACHHFISHRKPFKPQEEIDARLEERLEQNQPKDDSNINLIGLLEEAKLLDKKNPMGELQSVNPFLDESQIVGDEWEHIYASSVINANMRSPQEQLNQYLKEESWKQKNESAHGMLLVSKNDIDVPIGVGMLVAYRLNIEKAYCLAIVKWLRVNPHKGIAIGLQLIAVQSRAIAVKGIKGTGGGGQFQRAFLISENDTKGKGGKLHLIVPSGVYDEGSVLKVWHNEKLNYVMISDILLATDSFERVAFNVVTQ
ncbi:MAG: hypothetical protein OQL19_18505 [Gammaproteobacteria bacterium]|nr:hypothetical protein [Gammaproteobacteria bacterium]